jgi:hypothetical protein
MLLALWQVILPQFRVRKPVHVQRMYAGHVVRPKKPDNKKQLQDEDFLLTIVI